MESGLNHCRSPNTAEGNPGIALFKRCHETGAKAVTRVLACHDSKVVRLTHTMSNCRKRNPVSEHMQADQR